MPTLTAIAFDCRDVTAQAQFWSALLERPLDAGASPSFASIGNAHDGSHATPGLLFLRVPGERDSAKNPVHVDLFDPDIDAAAARAVELGAQRVAHFDEFGVEWITLRDPEGNLFDIGRPSDSSTAV